MRFLIPAIGSRGDVQPFINLAQGLQAAGHTPVIATNPTLLDLPARHGIPSVPVGSPVDMGAAGARVYAQSRGNFIISLISMLQFGIRLAQEASPDILRLLPEFDQVIVTDTGAGGAEADARGVPWVSVTLQPARVPAPNQRVSPLMKAFFAVANRIIMAPNNRFRKKVGALPIWDMAAMLSSRLTLLPVSPLVAPPNPHWPAQVHMTGYWFPRPDPNFTPPADLMRFLDGGPKPVVISLGAMSLSGELTRQAALMTLEALRQAGLRAVIQGWEDALRGETLPETIYHAGSLPHDWLFAQAAAVVHHGGFGTTASGLRSGAPAVVIPHIIDQIYWADLVAKLGAGPAAIHRPRLSVERLASALTQAVTDETMRARAAEIGAQIRAEPDGVTTAVGLILAAK